MPDEESNAPVDSGEASPEEAQAPAAAASEDEGVEQPGLVDRAMSALGSTDDPVEAAPAKKSYRQCAADNEAAKRRRKYGR